MWPVVCRVDDDRVFGETELVEECEQLTDLRVVVDHRVVIEALRDAGLPCLKEAAMAKLFASEMAERVCSDAIQVHGGYGYMWEYPIARAYADARVQRIYGGTNEIMKEVISRSMGLGGR